jgi:hypothetical protein
MLSLQNSFPDGEMSQYSSKIGDMKETSYTASNIGGALCLTTLRARKVEGSITNNIFEFFN